MIELLRKSIRKAVRGITHRACQSDRMRARMWQRLKGRCGYRSQHSGQSNTQSALLPLQHREPIRAHLHETEHYLYVWVEVAGMSRRDLSVRITIDRLSIEGCKKHYRMTTEDPLWPVELTYAAFEKIITLPSPVDAEQADIRCDKGMLQLKLMKLTPDHAL